MTNKDSSAHDDDATTAAERARLNELKQAREQEERARLAREAEESAMKAKAVGKVLGRRFAGLLGKR